MTVTWSSIVPGEHHLISPKSKRCFHRELGSRRSATGSGARFRSIEAYVAAHQLRKYLILDDAPDEFPLDLQAFVVCHPKRGIDSPEVKEWVIRFLNT